MRLPGAAQSRWLPIGEDQADALTAQLHSGAPWLAVTTVDGRAVLINTTAVQRLALLDDGADEPDGDWWHADHGAGLGARDSRVHYASGAAESLTVDPAASWGAFNAVEQGWELPAQLCLSCSDDGLSIFVAPGWLAMLDMPLQPMYGAARDELAELRAESERRARLKRAA